MQPTVLGLDWDENAYLGSHRRKVDGILNFFSYVKKSKIKNKS
jgi:hypothetical protein